MDNDVRLLDQLLAQSDKAMAAIEREVERDMPPADDPTWKRLARGGNSNQTPTNSILNAPGVAQVPVAECICQPDDLQHLTQQSKIDLGGGVVRCQRCRCVVPKSIRTKQVRWMRGIARLNQQHPDHVDKADLEKMGVIYVD